MPANIKVFRAQDFIRAQPDGSVSLGKTRELLAQIAAATTDLDEFDILIDARRAKGAHTPNELWTLAQELLKYRKTFERRTGLLVPFEKFDRATYFALCAEQKGFKVHVFTSYEDAMEWLLGP